MSDDVKILAVDDDQMNLELIALMLSDTRYEVIMAHNGCEAMEMLDNNPGIDAILLDLEMPVMDGYKTIGELKRASSFCREIPIIVVTAGSHEVTRALELGANDFLTKPYNPQELRLRVMNHVHGKKLADCHKSMNQRLEHEVASKTMELENALHLSQEAEYQISLRLAKAAEFRDSETALHNRRISRMSRHLGILAGFSQDQCHTLYKASPLHDVGKIGIPDRILLKPGKLSCEEFEIMKRHTTIGATILSDSGRYSVLNAGAVIALQHHEKWDGSGYPMGLKGNNIHEYARIVSIVDVFDALASERPYKKAFPLDQAVGIMKEGRAEFFDPWLLDLFLHNIDSFAAMKESVQDGFAEARELPPLLPAVYPFHGLM